MVISERQTVVVNICGKLNNGCLKIILFNITKKLTNVHQKSNLGLTFKTILTKIS